MNQFKRIASITVAALVLVACAGGPPANTAADETVIVRRGDLTVTVSSSGTIQPARSANLSFGTTGTVEKVLVDEGQVVKQGQELGALDIRDLNQQVVQSEANLQTAQARLEQAKTGNATEQDLAAQQANVAAAEAQAQKARTGNITQADIANAQAAIRNAEAGLARARSGNVTPADIASAEAAVRNAEAGLQRARTGNVTEADIASAEAAVRQAEAQYQKVASGPTADLVSAAQTRLTQAQQNFQKIAASASASKTSAEQNVTQAADSVRIAQTSYESAYWDNQKAQGGVDPRTGKTFDELKLDENIEKQKYAEALRNAELQLSQAQSRLEQAKVAADNARQQEINDVANAQAQVDDAQVQLDELLKGPKSADVAAAQAQVDQARAQLQKLRQGGTAADIAAAQAQVDVAQAQLEKLTAASAPSDISIAEAGVAQAEAQLTAAKLSRDKAVLRAPFDGIITNVGVVVGDNAAAAGATSAFTLVDDSQLHLEVNISESDVAQVKEGQTAQVTIDALGTDVITGTVEYIAPAATVVQDVTTYLVRVELPDNNTGVRVGMNASIDIGTATKQNVLIIPTSAIRSEGNRRFVRIKQGEGFTDREVKLGLSNDVDAEVVSGLEEGDTIAALGTEPTPNN